MTKQLWINLPVLNAARSRAFYDALGFAAVEQYCSEHTACARIDDRLYLMLLEKNRFAEFTSKPVVDATCSTEVLICLGCDSRAEVDRLVRLASDNGGRTTTEAKDQDGMYGHGFEDPDGHIWELGYFTSPEIRS